MPELKVIKCFGITVSNVHVRTKKPLNPDLQSSYLRQVCVKCRHFAIIPSDIQLIQSFTVFKKLSLKNQFVSGTIMFILHFQWYVFFLCGRLDKFLISAHFKSILKSVVFRLWQSFLFKQAFDQFVILCVIFLIFFTHCCFSRVW